MGNISLLDCTLRDGGYINDWNFGEDAIKGTINKISLSGIDMLELGFIKGTVCNPNRTLFPSTSDIDSITNGINVNTMFVAMLDMSNPVEKDKIAPTSQTSLDGIRVIFKKNKIDEAFDYCEYISKLGYKLFVNLVNTEQYSDGELVSCINKFQQLKPYAFTIVDTFGVIKKNQFLHIASIFDRELDPSIILGYHAHNNLQQAFGNAEAFVEMNLERDIYIDACVFGMGRGAGNLNIELFAEYLNENYDKNYRIEPLLEIMDEYLSEIYKTKFWGYSLPLYLSARHGCHPNYAIYLAEKDSLTEKMFDEVLSNISSEDKLVFSKEKAELYYQQYMENYIDDKDAILKLSNELSNKSIVLLAPGTTLKDNVTKIKAIIDENNSKVIAVNFLANEFNPDFVFSSNMRRYVKMQSITSAKRITTSNMRSDNTDYVINFSSYSLKSSDIIDNSGLMLLNLLIKLGVKEVYIAGMDGYSSNQNYYDKQYEYDFSTEIKLSNRNELISSELNRLSKQMKINFITPTNYVFEN